jgi:transglutaminase superfamily protein
MIKIVATYSKLMCLFLFLITSSAFSQNYSQIDNIVRSYPKGYSKAKQLADRINADFTTDESKARAIFTWIALNTRYDLKASQSGAMITYRYSSEEDRLMQEQKIRQNFADKTLRTGKGVCQDYSSLFHVVCDLTGLKCIDIAGTSKAQPSHIGKLPNVGDHEWNAVKIGNHWKLIDVTWASGSVSTETGKFVPDFNDAYFFTAPEVFFLNHFPENKKFLMIDKTAEEFANLPLYYGPYINSDYEIAVPENGVISSTKSKIIPFRIIDFPYGSKISYAFTSEGRSYNAQIRKNGNISEFEIPMGSRSRGFLTVFADNNAIATYKIER